MTMTAQRGLGEVKTQALIEELHSRGDSRLAINVLRNLMPWWRRFQLGPNVWGLSGSWLAACPWNGDEAWIALPLVTLIAGKSHIELVLGHGKWTLNIDIRWRWE